MVQRRRKPRTPLGRSGLLFVFHLWHDADVVSSLNGRAVELGQQVAGERRGSSSTCERSVKILDLHDEVVEAVAVHVLNVRQEPVCLASGRDLETFQRDRTRIDLSNVEIRAPEDRHRDHAVPVVVEAVGIAARLDVDTYSDNDNGEAELLDALAEGVPSSTRTTAT